MSQQITTYLKSLYLTLRAPLVCVILFAIIYAFYTAFLANFIRGISHAHTIRLSLDLLLTLAIFASSSWLVMRILSYFIDIVQNYAKTHQKKVLSLIFPLLANSLKVIAFIWLLYGFVPYFNIPGAHEATLRKLVNVITILVISFVLIRSIVSYEKIILNYYTKDLSSSFKARQIYTQTHILRQIMISVVIILTLGAIFMVFENMREIGVSILASAGLVSAIIGLAAQKSLANLIACLQLAFTRIVKIGDDVVVETEFGQVEEITLTYIIIKLWDLRRLIIPINYLNEKSFLNLTRHSTQLIGTVFLYVDYSFPVESARKVFKEIVSASRWWDKEVAAMHVTNASNTAIELRFIASASSSGNLWELRCEIREKMINYVVNNYPDMLPKLRTEIPVDSHTEMAQNFF
ncbi:MAG: hypothetical protein K0S08_1831 [Gammaproteobacteria bacterium]|nr:hypothetical protein [Gammaproteobacteria bacterium]